jgi:hypothetical protein
MQILILNKFFFLKKKSIGFASEVDLNCEMMMMMMNDE